MGRILTAYCKICGFKKEGIYFGVGFINQIPAIPALKQDTMEIILHEYEKDPNLKFYHREDMYRGKISGVGIQCFDIHLSPEDNLCPSCGKFTMDFVEVGDWD